MLYNYLFYAPKYISMCYYYSLPFLFALHFKMCLGVFNCSNRLLYVARSIYLCFAFVYLLFTHVNPTLSLQHKIKPFLRHGRDVARLSSSSCIFFCCSPSKFIQSLEMRLFYFWCSYILLYVLKLILCIISGRVRISFNDLSDLISLLRSILILIALDCKTVLLFISVVLLSSLQRHI